MVGTAVLLAALDAAVLVAVPVVRVVQVVSHEVVHVVAVRHRLVAAPVPVPMAALMTVAAMLGRAPCGIVTVHVQRVLDHAAVLLMVQVPIVQVVHVVAVAHGRVAATSAVAMSVTTVLLMLGHSDLHPASCAR
jgi:hypothetical protein